MQKEVYEFISKQTNDPITQRKTCAVSGEEFAIFQSDVELFKKLGPTIDAETIPLPLPIYCPRERARRRMGFRNERKLYRRNCDLSGKSLITIYKPNSPMVVYDQKIWRGDDWDALNYGRAINWNKTFNQQFKELFQIVPTPNVLNTAGENSDYCNHVGHMKDCYMVSASWADEACLYGTRTWQSLYCLDILEVSGCEWCYECNGCEACYQVCYGMRSKSCRNCWFVFGCENCEDCIGCWNLVGKRWCIFNEQLTEEEYLKRKDGYILGRDAQTTTKGKRTGYKDVWIYPSGMYLNCDTSFGDQLKNCETCVGCFNMIDAKNCKWCENGADNMEDMSDGFGIGIHCSGGYQIVDTGGNSFKTCFTITSHYSSNVYYSHNCHHSSFLFGCVGLRNKEYCIFNKQYTKKEWEQEVTKLISYMQKTGERGLFFDPQISPFGYNETIAQEYYPGEKKDIVKDLYNRSDYEYHIDIPKNVTTIDAQELPDTIDEVEDSIIDKVILCENSGKPYRITSQELVIYRKLGIPLPKKHYDIRHQQRVSGASGRELYLRKCDKTGEEMLSIYPQDTPFKVYSEEAYRQKVYG